MLSTREFALGILAALIAAAVAAGGCRPRAAELDQASMLAKMFPGQTFTAVAGTTDRYTDTQGRTFIANPALPGSYTAAGEEELLLVVTRPQGELSHAEGFYQVYAAVFEARRGRLVSGVHQFSADEGTFGIYNAQDGRGYLLAVGSVTYQGWTEWHGGLWAASATPPSPGSGAAGPSGTPWAKVWPAPAEDEAFWKDHAVLLVQDGLEVQERRILPQNPEAPTLIPGYEWVTVYRLVWDAGQATFVRAG